MDGWKESESQDQRWKQMMNSRWKYGRYVRKSGMDGACPSVECKWKRKSEWIYKWNWKTLDAKGGIKHLDTWMGSFVIYFSFYVIFKEFLLISPRCWQDSEKKDEVDWGMEDNDL